MRLRQRCRSQRLFVQPCEHAFRLRAQCCDQLRADLFERQRRHCVLQLAQLFDPLRRQQVHTRGQHLPQLDEGRPEFLERAPHPRRGGHAQAALGVMPVQQLAGTVEHVGQPDAPHHIAESVTDQHRSDFLQPPQVPNGAERFPHQHTACDCAAATGRMALTCIAACVRSLQTPVDHARPRATAVAA